MQLIDQSGIAEFFSIQYGLRPRTEDAEVQQEVSEQVAAGELEMLDDPALFRRVAGLPREVQVPEGWPADWSRTHALATAIDVRGDQALVKVFPFEPTRAGAGLRGCWGVWSMTDGRVVQVFEPGSLLGAGWCIGGLVTLKWTAKGDPDGYVIERWSGAASVSRTVFLDEPAKDSCAQDLAPLATGTKWWVVYSEAHFDVLCIDEHGARRVYRDLGSAEEPAAVPNSAVVSPDQRSVVWWAAETRTVLVHLEVESGQVTHHPVVFKGRELQLSFRGDGVLVAKAGDQRFQGWPLPQSVHLV